MGRRATLHALSQEQVDALQEDADAFFEVMESQEESLDLDKSWHALHYLLTGSASEGEPPLNFLVSGGHSLTESDGEYEARYLTPAETVAAAAALPAISRADLVARYDPAAMNAAEIYPWGWDDSEDARVWIGNSFESLGNYVTRLAGGGMGLLVFLI